jgi:ribose 5-phosphate isomerase A
LESVAIMLGSDPRLMPFTCDQFLLGVLILSANAETAQSAAQSLEVLKREAAAKAVALVRSGMKVGLGTGSTAKHFVDLLGARIKAEGLDIVGVPTSEATRQQAETLGIRLSTLDEIQSLDLTVDGADEIDPALNLIKGGGGAHLREKMVALASKQLIIIADETKDVRQLGQFKLPLEVVTFGLKATELRLHAVLKAAGCGTAITRRMKADGTPFVTDSGHAILDAACEAIPDPVALAHALDGVTGLVEHGLFIGMAKAAILATGDGIRVMGSLD